ncbi:MAG: sulfite exporter TauE/SafE family protein [Methanosarcinaceae archaeon]
MIQDQEMLFTDPLVLGSIVLFSSILFAVMGIGGAIVYVPLFYWLGMDLMVAIPVALMLNIVTAGSASITYLRKGMVDIHTAFPFILASVAGAPMGAYLTDLTPDNVILGMFSIVLLIAGILMIYSKNDDICDREIDIDPKGRLLLGLGTGLVIGIAAGLLGIGGGTFIVPLLIALGYGIKRATATSALIIVFTSTSGLLAHLSSSQLDMTNMAYMAVAALIGSQLGSHIMYIEIDYLRTMSERYFTTVFGIFIIIIALLLQYSTHLQ